MRYIVCENDHLLANHDQPVDPLNHCRCQWVNNSFAAWTRLVHNQPQYCANTANRFISFIIIFCLWHFLWGPIFFVTHESVMHMYDPPNKNTFNSVEGKCLLKLIRRNEEFFNTLTLEYFMVLSILYNVECYFLYLWFP